MFPLYYSFGTETVAFRKGVRGPGWVGVQPMINVWNVRLWEMD